MEKAHLTDFKVFLLHVWLFLRLPKPTKVQLDIADWLQHGPKRLILQAFRGVGKSWITVAFVLWILLLDPQKKVMVVSAGENLAGNFTKFCMQLIRGMELLRHLAPDPAKGHQSSTVSFDVGPAEPQKDPSVFSTGITGQMTGHRADVIVADDVETPKNSYTQLQRDRLGVLVQEFEALLTPLPASRILYLGTPQTEGSLYSRLAKERGYKIRIWPVQVPEDVNKYHGNLGPLVMEMIAKKMPPGTPVDPKRFTLEDLQERRLSYKEAGYALQYMLDVSPSDAEKYPLKLENLLVMDCDREMTNIQLVWARSPDLVLNDLEPGGLDGDRYHRPKWLSPEMSKYTDTIMAIDPSGRGKDETAYAVVKLAHGFLYVMDVGGYKDGYGEETLSELAGKALRWGVTKIITEKNFGDGMFDNLLTQKLTSLVPGGRILDKEEWNGWSKGNKENRILDILQPVVANHKLVLNRKVIEDDLRFVENELDQGAGNYSLIYQFTRMQRIKGALIHDDRLDALSMAVAYFTDSMSRDAMRALKSHKERLQDEELRKFIKLAKGKGPGRPRWNRPA